MKKLIALLLAVVMMVSMFAACAKDPVEDNKPNDSQTNTPDTNTPDGGDDKDTEPTTGLQADGSYVYEDGVVMSAPGEFPIVKAGEVTLTIGMHQEANVTSYAYGENDFTTYLQDRSGIKLEFDRLGGTSSEAVTQIQLRIATGEELPDIVLNAGVARLDSWDYMEDGIMLPLNEYIENYGYYYDLAVEEMAAVDPHLLGAINANNDPDGNMPMLWKYSLGPGSTYDKQWYINKQWLDTLGLEVPTTTDELYDVLVAFRDKDPNGNGIADEIPMMGANGDGAGVYVPNITDVVLTAFVYFNPRQHLIDQGDGKIQFVGMTDEFREGMMYINKLVDEGLIPDFSFTQNNAQMKAICDPLPAEGEEPAPSKVGVIVENLNFAMNLSASDRAFEYVALPPLTGPEGVCYASAYDTAMLHQNWITSDCEYPEIAFRFMDMFYDRETTYHMDYGEYGVMWWYKEDYMKIHGLEEDDIFNRYEGILENPKIEIITDTASQNFNAYSTNHSVNWAIIPIYYIPSNVNNVAANALSGYDITTAAGYQSSIHDDGVRMRWGKIPETNVPGTLLSGMTAEEEAATTGMRGNLNVHFFNTRAAMQIGTLDISDDAVWQAYLDECETYGASTLLKVYQNVYDRYLANQGK